MFFAYMVQDIGVPVSACWARELGKGEGVGRHSGGKDPGDRARGD